MHRIDTAIVREGKLVLSNLPFPDGQRVRVVVDEINAANPKKQSIQEVRRILKGRVKHFEEPFAPMIPEDDWETLK